MRYVRPKYRRHLANSMIRDMQYAARAKNLPIVLGCRNELISYFKRFCFSPIENFKSEECAFMFWSFSPTNIERRFELLFQVICKTIIKKMSEITQLWVLFI